MSPFEGTAREWPRGASHLCSRPIAMPALLLAASALRASQEAAARREERAQRLSVRSFPGHNVRGMSQVRTRGLAVAQFAPFASYPLLAPPALAASRTGQPWRRDPELARCELQRRAPASDHRAPAGLRGTTTPAWHPTEEGTLPSAMARGRGTAVHNAWPAPQYDQQTREMRKTRLDFDQQQRQLQSQTRLVRCGPT